MSFHKPCHMPFCKHIPSSTLTGVRHNQRAALNSMNSKFKNRKHTYPAIPY